MERRARRRVVISGIGAITPIGSGSSGLWNGVRAERSAVRRITRFDAASFPSQIAAEVPDFDPLDYMDVRKARRMDRFAQFGLAATRLAVEDAALDLTRIDRSQVGIYMGSALGGIPMAEAEHTAFLHGGLRAVNPMLALSIFGGASSSNIAIELGLTGPNVANANSCASGAIAIGEGCRLIAMGIVPLVLAGGVEAPLAPLTFGAFSIIKVLSVSNDTPARASRPFDRQRDGFVMGEGAAIVVLEELEHALRRDAPIYAEVLGYGLTNDGHHMTHPLPSGEQQARAVTLALTDADISASMVDYVNAHASSTVLNDRTETLALKRSLGERAYHIPVTGTKGMHGHALGASGAIEAAIVALALRHKFVPPTVNLETPDADCDLNYLPGTGAGRSTAVNYVLSTSFGFGGINAALVIARYPAHGSA